MRAAAVAAAAVDVQVQQVTQAFAQNGQPPLVALNRVSLSIQPGEFVSLVGPSGCGKSTLLHLVAGLQAPSEGQILLGGESPERLRARKGIGWMAQRAALLPWYTVLENVRLPLLVNRQAAQPAEFSPEALLEMVGLAEFAGAYPHTLSGGMQQRVALARTLAVGAPLWLMDEPFAALDELTREGLADDLLAIWERFRPTVLWVTHHLSEAVRLSDRIVLLSARPGQVAGVICVPLARPRDDTDAAFQAVVRRARAVLRGDADAA